MLLNLRAVPDVIRESNLDICYGQAKKTCRRYHFHFILLEMKIKLKNIGPISYSEFELGKLTVVSGKNNTGKTYVTYLLYCLLDFWTNEFVIQVSDDVKTSITSKGIAKIELQQYVIHANDVLKRASRQFSTPNVLARVFASEAEKFKDSEISIEVDKDEIDIAGHSKETSEFSLGIKNKSYIKITQENNCLNIKLLVGTAELPDPSLLNIIERSISDIIKKTVFGQLLPHPFISSAERTGSAIFQKDLDFTTSKIVEVLRDKEKTKSFHPYEFLRTFSSGYPIPVKKNVDFIRDLASIEKRKSYIQEEHPDFIKYFADIIGGTYKTDKKTSSIYYIPNSNKKLRLMLAESSSCVRSLLDLGYYIKHIAQKNDLLMIDEPEMNLHPENQRKIARLFAALANIGINVYITTHSDYILKEFSTLVVLSNKEERIRKIAAEEKYREWELLSPDMIRTYTATQTKKRKNKNNRGNVELVNCKISIINGILSPNFDDTITEMNRIQNRILWEY